MATMVKLADKSLKWAAVVLLAIMTVLVFTNVVLRYLFNSSIIVSEEVGRYVFVWMTFLGSIFAFGENAHIRVNIVVDRLPPLLKKAVSLVVDLLMLLCCILMSIGGWRQTVINMANPAPVSQIPIGMVYLAGLVGSAGIGLILVVRIAAGIYGKREEAIV